MKVTATVEFTEWDGPSIEQEIVAEAATRIIAGAKKSIIGTTREVVLAEIRAQVGDIIQEVVTNPMQQTNIYGERKGKPTTLCEIIAKEATEWLETRVSSKDGKPTTGRSNSVTRAYYLTRIVVHDKMANAYHQEINTAIEQVKATLDGKLSDMVRIAIINVLSLE